MSKPIQLIPIDADTGILKDIAPILEDIFGHKVIIRSMLNLPEHAFILNGKINSIV